MGRGWPDGVREIWVEMRNVQAPFSRRIWRIVVYLNLEFKMFYGQYSILNAGILRIFFGKSKF